MSLETRSYCVLHFFLSCRLFVCCIGRGLKLSFGLRSRFKKRDRNQKYQIHYNIYVNVFIKALMTNDLTRRVQSYSYDI